MALPGPLAKQLGPFPLGVWLLIGAGGVGLGLVIRNALPDEELPPIDAAGGVGVGGVGDGTTAAQPGKFGYTTQQPVTGGGYGPPPAASPSTGGATSPTTNTEWGRAAVAFLVGDGRDPVVAAQAIERYLAGMTLTAQQAALLSVAIARLGTPPEGAPAPDTSAPEAPPASTDEDDRWVIDLFHAWAGRAPTAEELNRWAGQLRSGTRTRDYLAGYMIGIYQYEARGLPVPSAKSPQVPAPASAPAAPAPAAPVSPRTYTVVPRDNLTTIAQRLGVMGGWQALYAANRAVIGSNPNLIRPGQVLVIP